MFKLFGILAKRTILNNFISVSSLFSFPYIKGLRIGISIEHTFRLNYAFCFSEGEHDALGELENIRGIIRIC